jgi:glycosyltransferase involved in cell wall biosynthesis
VEFYDALMKLQLPPGSVVQLYPGFFPHDNRNVGIQHAIEGKFDFCFFIDDDQILAPDAVLKLMAHDVDIVTCNLLTKEFPWQPYLFERIKDYREVFPLALNELPQTGLVPVDACGLGGVLVKTSVFMTKGWPFPWLNVDEVYITDDLKFCAMAKQLGYTIHADLHVVSRHIIKGAVWPKWNGTKWETVIGINGGGEVVVPASVPHPDYTKWRDAELAV